MRDASAHSRAPRRIDASRESRLRGANHPTTWEVGYRIGPALAAGRDRETADRGAAHHAGPRPHLRRAHWATYWTGPRNRPQKAVLRWRHPVLVAASSPEDIVPVERRVDEHGGPDGIGD